jgi:hypothetical protein
MEHYEEMRYRVQIDRPAGGHRFYCNSGGDASIGAFISQTQSSDCEILRTSKNE